MPPVTVYSISHATLLLVAASSKDVQSLAVLDFLYRLVDVFEDFLGSPLLANKIEDNYEVVAQLLIEMCDGGIVCNTEPNALRESVEVSSVLGKLFTQVGLSGYGISCAAITTWHADTIQIFSCTWSITSFSVSVTADCYSVTWAGDPMAQIQCQTYIERALRGYSRMLSGRLCAFRPTHICEGQWLDCLHR